MMRHFALPAIPRTLAAWIAGTLAPAMLLLCLASPAPALASVPASLPTGDEPIYDQHAYLPMLRGSYRCPTASGAAYNAIPVPPPPADRPAAVHGDLNLALRGYEPVTAYLGLVPYDGGTDSAAPQLRGLFADRRTPAFRAVYQVYDWNWACGGDGCRGNLLSTYDVTLLGMLTGPGEAIRIPEVPMPDRQIYGGGYAALVLYAEEGRITLKYTRDDNVVQGYTVHLENVCVDPNLLALYRDCDGQGRGTLPALRVGEALGTASGAEIQAAVRDNGTFLDPRSQKDWWR